MTCLGRYDLHLHTQASDGTLSPADTVRTARRIGLSGIAITDHDTMEGVSEAVQAGVEEGIRVLPGVEISTDGGTAELHILGYLFDIEDAELGRFLSKCRGCRTQRVESMVDKLRSAGYAIEFGRVVELSGDTGSIGRPHIADALIEKGYVRDRRAAFDRLLADGKPGHVSREKPTPEEAIAAIRRAGGISVLAHPGMDDMGKHILDLVAFGLSGLEAYHPSHRPEQEAGFVARAAELGLLVTGGSDSHGPSQKRGAEMGCRTVGALEVDRLLSARG